MLVQVQEQQVSMQSTPSLLDQAVDHPSQFRHGKSSGIVLNFVVVPTDPALTRRVHANTSANGPSVVEEIHRARGSIKLCQNHEALHHGLDEIEN